MASARDRVRTTRSMPSAARSVAVQRRTSWKQTFRSYVDAIVRSQLMAFIERRIGDGSILRLMRKWIHVGVVEDGRLLVTETGTGQGQVISPLLANIYLHHVLDEWFEHEVKPRLSGQATEIRYADDFILCFQYREDAERVLQVLSKRFAKFGLTLHPEKTRLLAFGRSALPRRPGDAAAGHLRLSRLHARMRTEPTGAVHDSRPDHAQTPPAECEGGGAVVPAASARPGRGPSRGAQRQTPGPLSVPTDVRRTTAVCGGSIGSFGGSGTHG